MSASKNGPSEEKPKTFSALTCYRIKSAPGGSTEVDLDRFVNLDKCGANCFGPVTGDRFRAKVYMPEKNSREVVWGPFLQSGFPEEILELRNNISCSALLIVHADRIGSRPSANDLIFAFSFGQQGRFLLCEKAYERGYGLRVALSLASLTTENSLQLRSADTKHQSSIKVQSRRQASRPSDFGIFNINRLSEILKGVDVVPGDTDKWGNKASGSDSLRLYGRSITFGELGDVCRSIDSVAASAEYQKHFDWIDNIKPVTDSTVKNRLGKEVILRLQGGEIKSLELSPPDIIDSGQNISFEFHFSSPKERKNPVASYTDLCLNGYLGEVDSRSKRKNLSLHTLCQHFVYAFDSDGTEVYHWTVWRCLSGELELDGKSYILDECEFFEVNSDYIADLNAAIDEIPESSVELPDSRPELDEETYNRETANSSRKFILLDRKNISVKGKITPVEICDLLSDDRKIIHVKRHLRSSSLSHLLSQGLVSAELLQMNSEFREKAHQKVGEIVSNGQGFDFFNQTTFNPRDFEITYAVIADWKGRKFSEAFPFFTKVNLREVEANLRSRGFLVALSQIPIRQTNQ